MRLRTSPRLVAAVAAGALLVSGGVVAGNTMATAAVSDVTVGWTVTNDWGNGFQAAITVKNNTTRALNPWAVTVPLTHTVTSSWGGTVTTAAGGYMLSGTKNQGPTFWNLTASAPQSFAAEIMSLASARSPL